MNITLYDGCDCITHNFKEPCRVSNNKKWRPGVDAVNVRPLETKHVKFTATQLHDRLIIFFIENFSTNREGCNFLTKEMSTFTPLPTEVKSENIISRFKALILDFLFVQSNLLRRFVLYMEHRFQLLLLLSKIKKIWKRNIALVSLVIILWFIIECVNCTTVKLSDN
jgi:hypothetical protein